MALSAGAGLSLGYVSRGKGRLCQGEGCGHLEISQKERLARTRRGREDTWYVAYVYQVLSVKYKYKKRRKKEDEEKVNKSETNGSEQLSRLGNCSLSASVWCWPCLQMRRSEKNVANVIVKCNALAITGIYIQVRKVAAKENLGRCDANSRCKWLAAEGARKQGWRLLARVDMIPFTSMR